MGNNDVTNQQAAVFAESPAVDVLVHGEGELRFVQLCRNVVDGCDPIQGVSGLSAVRDGVVVTTPAAERSSESCARRRPTCTCSWPRPTSKSWAFGVQHPLVVERRPGDVSDPDLVADVVLGHPDLTEAQWRRGNLHAVATGVFAKASMRCTLRYLSHVGGVRIVDAVIDMIEAGEVPSPGLSDVRANYTAAARTCSTRRCTSRRSCAWCYAVPAPTARSWSGSARP